jgi:predicted TIM-barrel fold metal-dependent hydrolase
MTLKEKIMSPRRQFLLSLAAVGASSVLSRGPLWAETAGPANRQLIDVHHHIVPPKYLTEAPVHEWLLKQTVNRSTVLDWTPARAVEEMDRTGTRIAISSISVPGVWFDDAPPDKQVELGRRVAREWSEYAARLMSDYPGRFGLFAPIPLPDIDGSLRAIEYALDVLKADGIGLFTSYGNKWPAHPDFAPVFEELNRRKAIAYFHPTTPLCCRGLAPGVPPPLIEYPTDTTRAIMQIVLSGMAHRLPDIRYIFAHAGGTLTAAVGRFASLVPHTEQLAQRLPHGLEYELRRFYYDTANSAAAITMNALMTLTPVSHILFGTDSPFIPVSVTADALDRLGLKPADLHAIQYGNAERLWPRFKA